MDGTGMMQNTDLNDLFKDIEGPATTTTNEQPVSQAQQNIPSSNDQDIPMNPPVQGTPQQPPVQQAPTPQAQVPPQGTTQQMVQQPMMQNPLGAMGGMSAMGQPMMAAPVVQQPQGLATVGDDFSIGLPDDMQSELAEVGIEVGDIGVKVSRVPIDRYKASASKIDRIGLLINKVIPIKTHYIEGVGSIICFHGKCCEVAGSPMVRYLFPIVVYTTDADGNISGGKVTLMMLSVGEDTYRTIITLSKSCMNVGGLDHVDLLVTCTDETYQKMTFVNAGPAVWRQYPQIANFLKEKWLQDGSKSYMAVARKMDEETFLKVMNLDDAGADNSAQSFDPSKSSDLSKFFS